MLLLALLLFSTTISSHPSGNTRWPGSSSRSGSASASSSHPAPAARPIVTDPHRPQPRPHLIVLPSGHVIHLTPGQQGAGDHLGLRPWNSPFTPPGQYRFRARSAPYNYDEFTRGHAYGSGFYHSSQVTLEMPSLGGFGSIVISTLYGTVETFSVSISIRQDDLVALYRTVFGRDLSQFSVTLSLLLAPPEMVHQPGGDPPDESYLPILPRPIANYPRTGSARASDPVQWSYDVQANRRRTTARTYERVNQARIDGRQPDFRIVFEWSVEWTDRPLLQLNPPGLSAAT